MSAFWDKKFAAAEFVYGTAPNNYFKQCIDSLTPGKILVPGAGEGRDAVYAATQGWDTRAIDMSVKGREKTMLLAATHNVHVNYEIADAADYTTHEQFDAIGMIYFHLPPVLRAAFHKKMIHCLKPGGLLFIEVFTPAQLVTGSFGPKDVTMLYTAEMLAGDFAELQIMENRELETVLDEGTHHNGKASIIRFKATKKR